MIIGAVFSALVPGIFGSVLSLATLFISPLSNNISLGTVTTPSIPGSEFVSGSILFVGDIMLGRRVERMMDEFGFEYPFVGTNDLIQSATIAVGNFEGTVPKVHLPTPDFGFRFSVRPERLNTLKDAGFDILSLANNHSYDHGKSGYENTKVQCLQNELLCVGHPNSFFNHSTKIVTVGDTQVGLFFLHTLNKEPTKDELKKIMGDLNKETDVQIAYVHWGDEYSRSHNVNQALLGRALIDVGADAVIGHHPHVVQGIERYQGKPIFYSLGNFIFDQYFSEDVQTGLAVRMTIEKKIISYTLIPLSNTNSRSQPQIATGDESVVLLQRILNPLRYDSVVNLSMGTIVIPRNEELQILVTKL